MPRLFAHAALAALLLPLASAGQQSAPPTKKEIADAIRELGSKRFAQREKAMGFLWRAGRVAEPALYEARAGAELEVARRIDTLLDKFKWGVFPDTPPDVLALIGKYRTALLPERQKILKNLFDRGAGSYGTAGRLVAVDDNLGTRQQLFAPVAAAAEGLVPALLRKRQYGPLEDLLLLRLAGQVESGVRDYAVYLLMTGRIDDTIAHYRVRAGYPADPQAAVLLTYLYRAKGDLAGARAAAEKSSNTALLQTILYEQGDWKALSEREDKTAGQEGAEEFRAAYHRLAGRRDAFEQSVAALVKAAAKKPENDGTLWWEAKALFLNDRPREALTVLARGPDPGMPFDVLAAQFRYREGFALLDKAKARDAKQALRADLLRLKALHRLGEKEAALTLLAALEKQLEATKETDKETALVEVLHQIGMEDRAFRRAAVLLDRPPAGADKGQSPAGAQEQHAATVLAPLFPDQSGHLRHWWALLRRRHAGEESAATLRRLRDLLGGKVKGKALAEILAAGVEAAGQLPAEEREPWLDGMAAVCGQAGEEALARKCREDAVKAVGNAAAFRRLGEFLIEKKLWKNAAEVLGRGAEKHPGDAVLVYFHGLALTRTGREKEGRELMEHARWLPLGEDERRGELAAALDRHGLGDEARREYETVLRTGRPNSWHTGEAWRQLHTHAVRAKDYLKAAACWERFYLRVLEAGSMFLEDEAYVFVPHRAHWLRARGRWAAKDSDGAWREIQTCLTLLPGGADVPIFFVPTLAKAGDGRRADELFGKVMDTFARHCKEFPGHASEHNSLAWVAARCRRQLDKALEHARKAVKLEPKSPGYLDTLAEVQFQRGEQAEAIRLMRRCLDLAPDRDYYRRQLKRFEVGDRSVEVAE